MDIDIIKKHNEENEENEDNEENECRKDLENLVDFIQKYKNVYDIFLNDSGSNPDLLENMKQGLESIEYAHTNLKKKLDDIIKSKEKI